MTLTPAHVTPGDFAPFGMVVLRPTGTPTSQAVDYKFWSDIARYTIRGETEIGICTVYRQPEVRIDGMERHLHTPEILIPIDAPFVLPLLLDGAPVEEARAFRVNIGEAVVINPAVWHGACLPLGQEQADYFVIFRRGTPREDVEKKPVRPFSVRID